MKKILTVLSMVSIFTIFVGCPKGQQVSPMPPVVTDQNMCAAACDHIGPKGLNCKQGQPIDMKVACTSDAQCLKGQHCSSGECFTSCADFCVTTENVGIWLDPTCVATVASCDLIDSCPAPVAGKLGPCLGNL